MSFSDRLLSVVLSITFFQICIFSRTTEAISTKLGTKHPWLKGIQVCSNEGPCSFPWGHNYEITKCNDERARTTNCEIGPVAHQNYEIWNYYQIKVQTVNIYQTFIQYHRQYFCCLTSQFKNFLYKMNHLVRSKHL